MEKFLKLSKKDLKEIEENIKRNRADRMRYIDQYTDWLKKTPNKKWSTQQNKVIAQN
jgi:hypothetical protein